MITFERDNIKFNFRVAGILIHHDRVLLHTTLKDNFWSLPGGRAELNEDTGQTIVREFKEELDLDVRIDRLGFIREDFFEYEGKQYHEIGFYYFISTMRVDEHITNISGNFNGKEDDGRLIFRWFPIESLKDVHVYPENLRSDLVELMKGNGLKHFINH